MPAIDLSIDDLILDTENPRIPSADSQRDAIQRILAEQGEKLFALAESIAADGMSPIDRLLVVRENVKSKRFVALEGNRRVAALKLLHNPAVLTDLQVKSSLQKRLEQLAAGFDRKTVEPVACFEIANREVGMPWILLRHTGENEGKGVVDWTAVQKNRFRGKDPALQALEWVRLNGDLTEAQKERLGDKFPISTLERLLANPEVRKRLGIEIKNRTLCSGLPADELIKPLRRIVCDLGAKVVRVGQLMKSDQQISYIDSFDAESKSNHSKN